MAKIISWKEKLDATLFSELLVNFAKIFKNLVIL